MLIVMHCLSVIIRHAKTRIASSGNSSAPASKSCSERSKAMPFSLGDGAYIAEMDSSASSAVYSETKAATCHRNSYAKRTQSLITSGLVKGILPMSMRKLSNQQMLDSAFFELDGEDADEQGETY